MSDTREREGEGEKSKCSVNAIADRNKEVEV